MPAYVGQRVRTYLAHIAGIRRLRIVVTTAAKCGSDQCVYRGDDRRGCLGIEPTLEHNGARAVLADDQVSVVL